MFDVTFEAGWRRTPPNGSEWMQRYAQRRFGGWVCSSL